MNEKGDDNISIKSMPDNNNLREINHMLIEIRPKDWSASTFSKQ